MLVNTCWLVDVIIQHLINDLTIDLIIMTLYEQVGIIYFFVFCCKYLFGTCYNASTNYIWLFELSRKTIENYLNYSFEAVLQQVCDDCHKTILKWNPMQTIIIKKNTFKRQKIHLLRTNNTIFVQMQRWWIFFYFWFSIGKIFVHTFIFTPC